jgi:hypothetical protein
MNFIKSTSWSWFICKVDRNFCFVIANWWNNPLMCLQKGKHICNWGVFCGIMYYMCIYVQVGLHQPNLESHIGSHEFGVRVYIGLNNSLIWTMILRWSCCSPGGFITNFYVQSNLKSHIESYEPCNL